MLKIGEFSRLSQISIKALRHYDNLELLQPSHIDRFTGYRYYTLEQLSRAHRIMALKEMGLSLEQIGVMLNQEMRVDELRGMLRLKHAEIDQHVREEQKRLAMVEFHLHMIEWEGKMPDLNVVIKDTKPFKALFLKVKGKTADAVSPTRREMLQTIAERGIQPVAPQVDTLYGDEINVEDFEYAFAVPVDDSVTENIELPTKGTLILREMPAVRAATIVVEDINDVHKPQEKKALLQRWAIENGYTLCNEMRVVHLKGPSHDINMPVSEWITEFQVIVESET